MNEKKLIELEVDYRKKLLNLIKTSSISKK